MNKALYPILGATHARLAVVPLRLDITGAATPTVASTSSGGYISDNVTATYTKGWKRISAGLWEFKSLQSFIGPVSFQFGYKAGTTNDAKVTVDTESMTDSTPTFRIRITKASDNTNFDPAGSDNPSVYVTMFAADSGANL